MKNFGTLLGYEMKKIWKRPLVWVAVVLCGAVFVCITPIPSHYSDQTFTAVDAEGEEICRLVTAEEQFRAEMEGSRVLSGRPMDETFFRKAREKCSWISYPTLLATSRMDSSVVFSRLAALIRRY